MYVSRRQDYGQARERWDPGVLDQFAFEYLRWREVENAGELASGFRVLILEIVAELARNQQSDYRPAAVVDRALLYIGRDLSLVPDRARLCALIVASLATDR